MQNTDNSIYKKKKNRRGIGLAVSCTVLVLFVVMLIISGYKIADERTKRYTSFVEAGNSNLKSYQFTEATEYFDEAIRINKNSPEPYLGKAQVLLDQGDIDQCSDYLDEIEAEIPGCSENAQFNYLKGTVCFENKKYDDALEYIRKAHEYDITANDYTRDLAVCYAKTGDLDRAEEILNTIQSDGTDEDILAYIKGQVTLAKGDIQSAISDFENVISVTDDEELKTRAYIELSDIYKSMRHDDTTNWTALNNQINVLERAVKDLKNENNLIITEAMAEAYFTADKYDLSIEKFKTLLEGGYERAYIYRNIAIIYQEMNDFDSAEYYLNQMKEKYPDNYQCYMQLAYLYMDEESHKAESVRNYSKVSENYNLAVRYAPNGENTSDIIQLTAKINELKQKGWL